MSSRLPPRTNFRPGRLFDSQVYLYLVNLMRRENKQMNQVFTLKISKFEGQKRDRSESSFKQKQSEESRNGEGKII